MSDLLWMQPQAKEALTDASKQLLSNQVFDQQHPNAIIQDFETMIGFIQNHKLEVSANQHAITPKYLATINSQLSHPITIDFQRPSQKNYPYIHGLYLLLRASAIATIAREKKKAFLQINRQVLALWEGLNHTEKYFNLLATWMFYADESIMTNDYYHVNDWYFVLLRWGDLQAQVDKNNSADKWLDKWLTGTKFHNVALLHLFGWINLQDAKPLTGKGWRVIGAQITEFGLAMMNLLQATNWQKAFFEDSLEEELEDELNTKTSVNATKILQAEFQSCDLFPQWQQNLELPLNKFVDGNLTFKVSLGKAWRKIIIPSDLTLYDFSESILEAFDFDNDHLHQFIYKDIRGMTQRISHPESLESPFTDQLTLQDWQINIDQPLIFVFDFGDWWEFEVVLESVSSLEPKLNQPQVIEQYGKAPEQYPDYE